MNDLDQGGMFIPLLLTEDELGSWQAICEKFTDEPCCPGHEHDAKQFIKLIKKLLKHKNSADLKHLSDSWNQPIVDEDREL